MRYRNIYYINAEPLKNMGNFRDYLIDNTENLVTFHFFLGFSDKLPYVEKYKNGKKIFKKEFGFYRGKNNYVRNTLYFIYYFYTLFRYADRESFVITASPIFCFLNSIASMFKKTKHVFWIGDYYPDRTFPMNIYHYLVDFYNTNLEYVLYVSPPLDKIYNNKNSGKYRDLVTLGIKNEVGGNYRKKNKTAIAGFIGIIREQQGLDLFFEYLKKARNVRLEVVGDGYKLPHYKKLATKFGISKKIKFHGFVNDETKIFKKWDIGLALYENKPGNLSIYCEPTKIKHYLKFGIPVVTTNTTYFNTYVKKFKAGEVIEETVESLSEVINKINNNYDGYLSGVRKIVQYFDYEKWYKKEFKFMEIK